jgi:molecular chaperone DnaJ
LTKSVKRDYYAVLGVGRDADGATVKKAFRQLARELHPDVSDAPDADERFKEVVEAYEVLSSSERRELYDRYGFEGLQSGGFVPTAFDLGNLSDLFSAFFGDDLFAAGGRGRRGADVGAEVTIDLADAAKGVTRSIAFSVAAACGTCGGNGLEPGTAPVTCPTCNGLGRLQHVSRTAFGEFVRTRTCSACGGIGSVIETPCPTCEGAGRTIAERAMDVTIPAGIHDGQRIRISGEGHAGTPGGVAGDVYVLVRVRPDPRFVREGNDIFSAVDITLTQAALGTTLKVATLDGEREIELEAGTQPGDVRVLRGDGMPVLSGAGRGDHRVLVNVLVPRRLTAEQRRLLETLAESENGEMYAEDPGLLGRLKAHFR